MRGKQWLLLYTLKESTPVSRHSLPNATRNIGVVALSYAQVDVEQILKQVAQGTARADTVIRGQYDLLSGSMDREQKTKRELVSSTCHT